MIISLQCSVLLGNLCPDIYVDVLWPMQTIRTHLQTKYTPRAYPMPWWQLTLLVFLKEHPHESQDPRLRCQEMISVTHFICQCFKCFGSLVYVSFLVEQRDFFLSLASYMIWTHDNFSLEMQSGGGAWAQVLYVCFSFMITWSPTLCACVCLCVCLDRCRCKTVKMCLRTYLGNNYNYGEWSGT